MGEHRDGSIGVDEPTVGYSDNECKRKKSDKPTKLSQARKSLLILRVVEKDPEQLGRAAVSRAANLKRAEKRVPVLLRDATPEVQPGEFVGIINELARQWASRRDPPANQPIQRHLIMVSNRDHGVDPPAILPRLDHADG